MQFVVLSSSKGTVFQSVIDAIKNGSLSMHCAGLISDDASHGCVAKARAAGLPVAIVARKTGESRELYDKRIDESIQELLTQTSNLKPQTCIIACIGWMWLLGPWFVNAWKNRILNVHPSLLPKHPGVHPHELVLASGDTESGMTIHKIDEGMDTGTILLQKKCPVLKGDTVDTLKARVQELEREWYPKVLEMIERGKIMLNENKEMENGKWKMEN